MGRNSKKNISMKFIISIKIYNFNSKLTIEFQFNSIRVRFNSDSYIYAEEA